MRRVILCCVALACVSGCRNTRPRWEIAFTVSVESKLDKDTKTAGSLVFKRPIPGSTPVTSDKSKPGIPEGKRGSSGT